MTTRAIPDDPFGLVEQPPLALAGLSAGVAFGAPVEIRSLPRRREREGMPAATRPVFQANRADAIIAAEAAWRAPGMALTGNRFPFCEQHLLLWSTERQREPTHDMLAVAFAIEDAVRGSSMINSIGAAGSVTRSHVHIVGDAPPFLAHLEKDLIGPRTVHLLPEHVAGCEVLRLAPPFPGIAVGLRGPAPARARAVGHLLEARVPQPFNLVSNHGAAWLFPRSPIEITAPHFPQALGAAELAGLWCCNDARVFEQLATADMEAAIRIGGLPWPG